MQVGLETVVSVFPENVVKGADYDYLEPVIPPMLKGAFRMPAEMRKFIHDDAAEILAEQVAQKALDSAGYGPADIDYIIANNCGGKFTVPMIGTYIHHKLGFRLETPVLNISQACASFVDACEVAWNPQKQWLLAGSTSKRILDPLWEHLENHLRIYPLPLYHVHWALRLLPLQGPERDILTSLVSPESSNVAMEGRFLGYEFLTWLWFFSEESQGRIELADNRQAEIHLGDRLTLSRPDDGNERVICTTQASNLHEARTALRHGKMVEEAQLYLAIGDSEYFLRLDANLWALRSLRTPRQMRDYGEEEADGRFLEKMYYLEQVFACLDAVYGQFLSERLTPKWESKTWPQMMKWFEED